VKKILIIGLVLVMTVAAFAVGSVNQGNFGFQNMKGLAGVRAMGMGGAFTAVANDSSAIYWNPAGLSKITRTELNGQFVVTAKKNDMSIDSLSQSETNFTWGSFVTRIGDTGFGLALNNLLNVKYDYTVSLGGFPGGVTSWYNASNSALYNSWKETYNQTLSVYSLALSQKLWVVNIGLVGNVWSGSDKTNWNVKNGATQVLLADREYKLGGYSIDLGLLSQMGSFSAGATWKGLMSSLEQETTYTEVWTGNSSWNQSGNIGGSSFPKKAWQGKGKLITFGLAFEPGIITLATDIDYNTDSSKFGDTRFGAEIDLSLVKARAGMSVRKLNTYNIRTGAISEETVNDYAAGVGMSLLGYIDADAAVIMEGYKKLSDASNALENANNVTFVASGTVRL
jgi:hypothetical protein